jgi:hypothetical protein
MGLPPYVGGKHDRRLPTENDLGIQRFPIPKRLVPT